MDEYPASIDPNIVVQMDEYPPSIEPLGVYKFCGSPPCLFPQSVAVFEGSMGSCNKFCDNNEAVQNPSNNACAAAIRPRAVHVCGLSYFPRLQARMDEINNYAPLPQEEHNYGSASASKGAIREMMFREASLQPVSSMNPDTIRRPRRRNVRISKDPQSVAARHRRERISEKMRILQKLVPGGSKMDTASMLDEAIHYVKFLKRQLQALETEIFWRFSHLK